MCASSGLRLPAAAVLVIVFFLAATAAQAACRIGSGPELGDGIPYCWQLNKEATPAPYPEPYDDGAPLVMPEPPVIWVWVDRWGAIAMGGGGFGAASGLMTEHEARDVAKMQCLLSNQGKGCDEFVVYSNECVASAEGSNGYTVVSRWSNPDYAKQRALASCRNQARDCKVFYVACSDPVRMAK